VTLPILYRLAASSSAYHISLVYVLCRLTLISIGRSFLTVFTGFTSGCLLGDVERGGIEGVDIPVIPLEPGFMVRVAEGVEKEDESLGPAVWFGPN